MRRGRFLIGASLVAICVTAWSSHAGATGGPDQASPAVSLCVSRPGASAVPATVAEWASGAQLFDGLGDFHRKVTTASDAAQAYFDQGMRFLWAFNHDESTRSFAKAAELDPSCAMCFWGVALTVGPNYNLPMMAEPRAKVAWAALQQATSQAAHVTPVEQALITALAARYPNAQPLDPSTEGPVLIAYAHSMLSVAKAYPDDADVQTLTAEAMMNVNAWKLWSLDGKPADGTLQIVVVLENVLARNPRHPGANHYYIHAIEASPHPELAVQSAERLPGMMPAAGHLEHMPAHILQRVGRYADAADANRKGAAADLAYFAKTNPPDYYAMYTGHNYQFEAFSAAMQGRKTETLEAARKSRAIVPDEVAIAMPGIDWYLTELYAAKVRFGLWDEMLAEPPPNPKLAGLTAGYHYGRAISLAAKGRVEDAKVEQEALERIDGAAVPDDAAGLNAAKDVYAIAILLVKARIAAAQSKPEEAIAFLTDAVIKEDGLAYDEPSDWFFPTRHVLGAALLQGGNLQEAESVFREDLRRHPENGWALWGLARSLEGQHKDAEAQEAQRRFQVAWKDADIVAVAPAY